MLSRAGDYEILDVTGLESFITGQIMPVRNGGEKRILKYEDLLFLEEGKLERSGWIAIDRDNITRVSPPGRIFNWRVLWNACSLNEDFVKPDTEIPDGTFELSGGVDGQMKIGAELGGYVTLETLPYNRPLSMKREYLEKAFENLKKTKRKIKGISARAMASITGARRWNDGIERGATFPTMGNDLYGYGWLGEYAAWDRPDEYYYNGSYAELNVTSGAGIVLPYAKQAWLYTEGSISYSRYDGDGMSEYHNFVVKVCNCTVGQEHGSKNKRITMGGVNLRGVAKSVADHFGIPFVESGANREEAGWINLYDPFLVVDNEFPATPES